MVNWQDISSEFTEELVKEYLQEQKTKNSKLEKQLSELQNQQKQNQQPQVIQNPYHLSGKK
jgi:hypothetical protein